MNSGSDVDWICRACCSFFKADRTEQERCRGYTLATRLVDNRPLHDAHALAEAFDPSYKKSFLRSLVCRTCPFLVDGCDFTSPESPEGCLPCGGLVLLSGMLKTGQFPEHDLQRIDLLESRRNSYLSLTPRCSVKRLEQDYLYHVVRDELYEVNEEAMAMLLRCDGTHTLEELGPDPEFLEFCLGEDLLEFHGTAANVTLHDARSPLPSLRYLEWLVTFRCNLRCAHCYLGDRPSEEYPPDLLRPLLDQFSSIQGLRILVSGGEPTLYSHFGLLNDMLKDYPIRGVLLTNGTTMTEKLVARLNFHEVQISLDGMETGHDAIRGKGSFRRAVDAARIVRNAGLDLSVASMVHKDNLHEWTQMRQLVSELGAREWSIDYPCVTGRYGRHPELSVGSDQAAEKMALGFGAAYHGTSPGWTCGRHLAAVLPSAELCRCGLFQERCYGSVSDGLAKAWMKVQHIPIEQTDCGPCAHAEICGGGCRFRAGGPGLRDEVMCRFYDART